MTENEKEMREDFEKWCQRVPSSDQNWPLIWEAWQAAWKRSQEVNHLDWLSDQSR
jgi:hypothetical protein